MTSAVGRRARVTGSALALGAAWLFGCAPRDNGTLLVVRVDTDLAVPGQIDRVVIDVTPERGAPSTDTFTLTGRASLPVTLGLRPRGAPDFAVDVTARGLLGAAAVVAQTATVNFVTGQAQEFTLFLSSDCAGAGAGMCVAPKVCVAGPGCVVKSQEAKLRSYVPGSSSGDGGVDRGQDALTDMTGADVMTGADGSTDVVAADGAVGKDAHENPGTWSPVTGVPSAVNLSAVWPFADDDVWVAGAQAAGVVLHYDGTTWSPSAIPAGTPALYGLWGPGPGELWAVGAGGTILHFANNAWQTTKLAGTPAPVLSAIWGATGGDVWIVGSAGRTFHGDASGAFTPETSGVTASLFAVSGSVNGTGAADVWAVGAGGTIIRHGAGGWAAQTQRLSQTIFYGVWAGAASDVWVVGDGAALHFDGNAWTASSGAVDVALAAWGSAGDDVWTVGRSSLMTGLPIARWNGVGWGDGAGPPATTLQAVRGSAPTSVWAAGTAGAVLRFQGR